MLVKHTPDAYEKLQILGSMQVAGDDILSRPGQEKPGPSAPVIDGRRYPTSGVYPAKMPNGKTIKLLRVMFTDFCKMDCAYCPNSHWVPRKRYSFKVDELANLFMELHNRQSVAGFFLTSGIAGSASKTTERLVETVEVIRKKHGFKGYVHMKVMPGTEYQYVEAAYRLGTRLSVNLETPAPEMMRRLSRMKDLERDILSPMSWIDKLIRSAPQRYGSQRPSVDPSSPFTERGTGGEVSGAVGMATQMVVGAADESDRDIFQRIGQLYGDWKMKRVYYAPFRPVRYTPLEEHPPTPMLRTNRLYQMDWLKRIYQFSNDEIELAFDGRGNLDTDYDPKTVIALERLDSFPVDVNAATYEQLLRAPGVGPTSAERIVRNRKRHSISTWRDLQAMGVVKKKAWPFIVFPGHRPESARQLKLDLFNEEARLERRELSAEKTATRAAQDTAPCGEARSCAGCPMYGMPGHPGYQGKYI